MQNVLIVGATSDIAQAVARKFAAEGWSLTLAALEDDLLEPIAGDLSVRAGADVRTLRFDALDFEGHRALYESLPVRPDAVVACFGYMSDQIAVRSNEADIRRTIDINFTGMATLLSAVADDFERRGSGSIAAISSVAGDRGRQSNYIYGSAKAGLTAFLAGLRNRLAEKGVHVLTVKPGFVRTKMTENLELPAALTAAPEQVADAVYRGLKKKSSVVYTLWMWRWIMLVIRHIPEFIFKKMKM